LKLVDFATYGLFLIESGSRSLLIGNLLYDISEVICLSPFFLAAAYDSDSRSLTSSLCDELL